MAEPINIDMGYPLGHFSDLMNINRFLTGMIFARFYRGRDNSCNYTECLILVPTTDSIS